MPHVFHVFISIEYKGYIANFKAISGSFLLKFGIILTWYVYLLECSDGSYYAGITNRLEHRINAHNLGQGARYTRSRGPVKLLATQEHTDRSAASKAEAQLKRLARSQKLAFFQSQPDDGKTRKGKSPL